MFEPRVSGMYKSSRPWNDQEEPPLLRDVAKVRNRIFSDRYHLPRDREREEPRADG